MVAGMAAGMAAGVAAGVVAGVVADLLEEGEHALVGERHGEFAVQPQGVQQFEDVLHGRLAVDLGRAA